MRKRHQLFNPILKRTCGNVMHNQSLFDTELKSATLHCDLSFVLLQIPARMIKVPFVKNNHLHVVMI